MQPTGRRLAAFTRERFLPAPQLILIAVMYAAGIATAAALAFPTGAPAVSLAPLGGGLVLTILAFFHLRLMDDVKDAEDDRLHEPDRPIPRGLVTEREVNVLTAAVIAVEFVLAALIGPLAFGAWAVMCAYTLLMRAEFFASEYLDRHVMVFAVSHTVSMAFLWAMLVAVGWEVTGAGGTAATLVDAPGIWWMFAMAAAVALAFEMGRKTERYVAAHAGRAIVLWALLAPLSVVCAAVGTGTSLPAWTTISLWALALTAAGVHIAVAVRVIRAGQYIPPIPARDALELAPAVTGLTLFVVLAAGGIAL